MSDIVLLEIEWEKTQNIETGGFTLRSKVIRNEFIDPFIFVFERDLQDVDTFAAVATPVRQDEFPINEPASGNPFFRLQEVILDFDNLIRLNEVQEGLRADIRQLVDDTQLLLNDNLNTLETEVFEGEPE